MDVTKLPFDEARVLQKTYYRDHGTTLRGLMDTHGIDPDHFLSHGAPDRLFAGRRASRRWSRRSRRCRGGSSSSPMPIPGTRKAVLERLGGSDLFDDIFDIRGAAFEPKPLREAV